MEHKTRIRTNNEDLYEIAEQEGVSVLTYALPKCTAVTMPCGDGEYAIGIDPSVLDDSKKERVVVAHELGHCVTGSIYTRYQDKVLKDKAEYTATKWEVLNLIDKDEFLDLLKQGYSVWELAEIYDVTEDLIKQAYHFYCELKIA